MLSWPRELPANRGANVAPASTQADHRTSMLMFWKGTRFASSYLEEYNPLWFLRAILNRLSNRNPEMTLPSRGVANPQLAMGIESPGICSAISPHSHWVCLSKPMLENKIKWIVRWQYQMYERSNTLKDWKGSLSPFRGGHPIDTSRFTEKAKARHKMELVHNMYMYIHVHTCTPYILAIFSWPSWG